MKILDLFGFVQIEIYILFGIFIWLENTKISISCFLDWIYRSRRLTKEALNKFQPFPGARFFTIHSFPAFYFRIKYPSRLQKTGGEREHHRNFEYIYFLAYPALKRVLCLTPGHFEDSRVKSRKWQSEKQCCEECGKVQR